MALDPITAGIDLAKTAIDKIWPDKTQAEKDQIAAVVQLSLAQTTIDNTEAAQPGILSQWRGGMGWCCVAGYGWDFVIQPMTSMIAACVGHPLNLVPLDIGQLSTITLGMLGLGALHTTEKIKGAL